MSTERPDLDAIEALLTAATPGPWWVERDGCDDTCTLVGGPHGAWRNIAEFPFYAQFRHEPDERLIAAAPTALRTLLTYARTLESDRDYLQERVSDLGEQYAALEQERDEAQARHDADLWEIVAMLREQARIDWRSVERLGRVIAEIIEWDGPTETWAAPFTHEQVSRLRSTHAMADDQMVAIVAFGPDRPDCICSLPCDLDHFGDGDDDWQIRFGRMPLAAYTALPEHGGW